MSTESLFQLFASAIFISAVSISAYYRRKAARAGGERVSRREEGTPVLILLRLFGLATWLGILVYLINPQWMQWSRVEIPIELRWSGVVTGIAALPLIFWLFSSLGNNVTDTVAIRKQHTLVTHGPYRWVRHPLYTIGTLLFLSIILISANGFIALTALPALALLIIRTPIEEAKLIEKFGDDYRAYMQRTGRYLPRLTGGATHL